MVGGFGKQSVRRLGAIASAVALIFAAAPALAQTASDPKWGPHIDFEAKGGTERSLGEGDAFIPLSQDADTLLFANLRMRFDDSNGNEGNYGLGVRHMLDSGWNIGGYGYFDRRRTEYGNHFNQLTFGVEALSLDWDARANYYAPVGRRRHNADALNTAEVSGTAVTFRGGEERSQGGFDAELGWRIPIFDADAGRALRVYGGGYHFSGNGVEDITGPRARVEMTFDSLPLWQGSRFSVGAEWQHDDVRDGQGFLTARLRIPLQFYGKPAAQLTPMERRMADPIVRDIDVVSQSGAFGKAEAATQTADGKTFTVLNSATTAGNDLDAAVTAAGVDSTVILAGNYQVSGANTISLAIGQTLTGRVAVRSASGRTAVLNTGASISGTNVTTTAVQMNAGGRLEGLTVTNAYSGGSVGRTVLVADGSTGVHIEHSIITSTQSGANPGISLSIGQNTSVTLRNNTITATGSGAATTMTALFANNPNTTLMASGNTLSATGGTTNNIVNLGAGVTTILAGSTGNIRSGGACTGTSVSGSIAFTDGTTCP